MFVGEFPEIVEGFKNPTLETVKVDVEGLKRDDASDKLPTLDYELTCGKGGCFPSAYIIAKKGTEAGPAPGAAFRFL